MSRNKIIVLGVLLVAIVVGGGSALYLISKQNKPTTLVAEALPTPTPVVELTIWTDQSEYSFQYPKELTLNPHDEDQQNYSHVEFTSAFHPGSIILWTKDTTAKDIDAWLKQQKIISALDTTLGNEPAKKVLENDGSKITVTTIRDSYLYQIEVNLIDANFWNKILDTIVTSYTFTGNMPVSSGQTTQSAPADTGSSDVEYEGEEVIE